MTRRDRATIEVARIVGRQVADARGFAVLLRDAGSARLADAVDAELAAVAGRDIGGHSPKCDAAVWNEMVKVK